MVVWSMPAVLAEPVPPDMSYDKGGQVNVGDEVQAPRAVELKCQARSPQRCSARASTRPEQRKCSSACSGPDTSAASEGLHRAEAARCRRCSPRACSRPAMQGSRSRNPWKSLKSSATNVKFRVRPTKSHPAVASAKHLLLEGATGVSRYGTSDPSP